MARRLAAATGETLTQAVRIALEERLRRIEMRSNGKDLNLAERLDEIALHCASLPTRKVRSEDEILGFNEPGLPSGRS